MSWARFGSKCQNTITPEPENAACAWKTCPGSDVYVYEGDDGLRCDLCALLPGDFPRFVCKTGDEMRAHLREHVAAGHHVRPSLLVDD